MVASTGISPNQISILSVAFAAIAGVSLYFHADNSLLFVLAAAGIQLRLICNLVDGLVAVEGGKSTKSGEVFNDMPDRFSDLFILVPAGYSLTQHWTGPALGWSAGSFAVLTAYMRILGGALGLPQEFIGPMAKQHRMAVMTVACLAGAVEQSFAGSSYSLWISLGVVATGSLWTTFRRASRIVRLLESR